MANLFAGLLKGFADAGNESMRENDRFNKEIEKAARLQAMAAHAEKTKIFDQVKTLAPGTELARFMAKRAGIDWNNLTKKSQEDYTLEAANNYDEIIKQFDPGDAPTYDNYQGQLKQDKVVGWLKDKIGITPRHAYSGSTMESDLQEAKGREALILENKLETIVLKQGDVLYQRTGPNSFDKLLENPKANSKAFDVVNYKHKRTGEIQPIYKGSAIEQQMIASGEWIAASKYNLMDNTEIDWENDGIPARAYLRRWATAYSNPTITSDMTDEEKAILHTREDVANMILDWSKEEEDGDARFGDTAIGVIRNYRGDKTNVSDERKWMQAVEKEVRTLKVGGKISIQDREIPFTEGWGSDTRRIFPIKRDLTPRQKVMSELPNDVRYKVDAGIYELKQKNGKYAVFDSSELDENGKPTYITGGTIK